MRCALVLAILSLATALPAQQPATAFNSHEVNGDGSITLRLRAPAAQKVTVTTDMSLTPLAMQRDDAGIWSVTTPPLSPEQYSYTFVVDGQAQLDPLNRDTVPNLLFTSSSVLVPGKTPQPWELQNIPHGELTHHYLTTHSALHLPQNQEPYVVYTPAGYDPRRKGGYPVLYLLHGFSDTETGWSAVGHADFILDSLIDSGKAVPMLVVMPMGYGDFDFVTGGFGAWDHPERITSNVALFDAMLMHEVVPAVEREYNVAPGREHRAIAGLSMGGLESLSVGLHHTAQFAWIGSFSAAVQERGFDTAFPSLSAKQADLRLLWVGVGANEELLKPNRDFITWAQGRGFVVTAVEIPGDHTWLVWRDNLLHFAPLLFR